MKAFLNLIPVFAATPSGTTTPRTISFGVFFRNPTEEDRHTSHQNNLWLIRGIFFALAALSALIAAALLGHHITLATAGTHAYNPVLPALILLAIVLSVVCGYGFCRARAVTIGVLAYCNRIIHRGGFIWRE